MTQQRYQKTRRKKALRRWNKALELRKSGMKYREIAAVFGVDIALVFRWVAEAESESRKNFLQFNHAAL